MNSGRRSWKAIVPGAAEGARSVKKVLKSGYQNMFAESKKEQFVESTYVFYQLKGLWHDIITHKGKNYDTFEIIDTGHMSEEGAPRVPQEGIYVAIPENAEVVEVKIVNKTEKELEGKIDLLPAPKPVFEGEEIEYIPNKKIYESNDPFPGKYIDFVGIKHISHRKVAHIMIYLFQYKPKSMKVIALESIELEIVYKKKPGSTATPVQHLAHNIPLDGLILDSESISLKDKSDTGEEADAKLKNPDNAANYVIITTEDMKDSFDNFVTLKSVSYQIKLIMLTEILAEFPYPDSQKDKAILDFLKYATGNWRIPPQWVVLGGNMDKIPTHIEFNDGVTFVCDHYYADLNGDLCPDISVSRFPASTPSDMKKICDAAAAYHQDSGSWRKNVLFLAQNINTYIQCKDSIETNGQLNVLKRYDGEATKQQVIDTINNGAGIINYRGHGEATRWLAANGLTNDDIPELSTGNRPPQVFSICCWTCQLDYNDCFGVTWINDTKAITFLGASRASYTIPNNQLDKYLWDGIINHGLTMAGSIFDWGIINLHRNNPSMEATHNIYLYLLLGDPTASYKETLPSPQLTS